MLHIASCEITPVENVTLGLRCVTYHTPAIDVQWQKDTLVILPYVKYQTLLDGVTATYAHIIELRGSPVELEGAYTFVARNSHSEGVNQTLHVSGSLLSL